MSTDTDPYDAYRITLTYNQREQLARIVEADEPVEVSRPDDEGSFWIKSKGTYNALLVRFTEET